MNDGINKLHFKGEVANQEIARINENLHCTNSRQKVEGAYSIVSADMNMPLDDEETYPESGEDNTYGSNDERAGRGYS